MPYVENAGVRLYYEVHGQSTNAADNRTLPTIMLAHGMGGNAAIWFNQIAHYSLSYQVIAFDHRHFGRSACDAERFDPTCFASDALAIMDREQVDEAIWICQSMGGWTGSQLAVSHSDRVKALVMSHTPGIFEHQSAKNDTARLAQTLKSGFLPALAADFPQKQPVMAALYGAINRFNHTENATVSKKIGAAKMGVDIGTLKDYEISTLFITGDGDVLFEAQYIESLAKALPGAKFVNLGDVGHSSYFEQPEAFNAAVDEFLAGL